MNIKLTTQDFYTQKGLLNETLWGKGVTHSAIGQGKDLCSDGWIHFYQDPLVAVMMNPRDADIENPIGWKIKTSKVKHEGLKSGCKKLTTIDIVELPKVTIVNRQAFAILCTLEVETNRDWIKWANKWLSGEDRTSASAYASASTSAYACAYACACVCGCASACACAYTYACDCYGFSSKEKLKFAIKHATKSLEYV